MTSHDINRAKHEFSCAMEAFVSTLGVRDKRTLFSLFRGTDGIWRGTFFPQYGICAGEFATFKLLTQHSRKAASTAPARKKNRVHE